MQKMEHILWHGIVTVITAAALFVLMCRYSYAQEISGEEVYFTHSHTEECMRVESVNCAGDHVFYYHTSETATYHCNSCNAQTTHKVEIDVYHCTNVPNASTWQQNSYTKCTICGTIHSTWGGDPGKIHIFYRKNIVCGITEGESTLGIRIVADGAWTNRGVTLEVKQNVLKDDASDSLTLSWEGGTLFAAENGTYTVNAVNDAGDSVTASIEINCIDKVAPVIFSVLGDTQGMTASGIAISVTASDAESGLADAPYSFDGGATWTAGASFWLDGGREISLRVRDKAGNISERIVRRGDFPYPTPAPTPQPTPAPQSTPAPDNNTKQDSSVKPDNSTKQDSGTKPDNTTKQDSGTKPDNGMKQDSSWEAADSRTPAGGGESKGGASSADKSNRKNAGTDENNGSGQSGDSDTGSGQSGSGGTGNGYSADGRLENGRTGGGYRNGLSVLMLPQPAILKEDAQNDGESSFRVIRMDKARTAGAAKEDAEAMASYMQAVADGARYALTGGLSLQDGRGMAGLLQQVLDWLGARAGLVAGILLLCIGVFCSCRMLWLYSAELYCYDGGNEYRRLGFLYIRRRKKELELYLPDYILAKTGMPRYRLVVKNRLVKRFGKMDLLVHSDEHRLRRPLEECVDFVL